MQGICMLWKGGKQMDKKLSVVAVAGPTATGKTALGIGLARRFQGEIVSCDSMQVYKGLPIGTAQPTPAEQAQAPHHLVGFLEVEKPFSVSDYVGLAGKAIADIAGRGRLPLLVGGTGLYVRSLLNGFSFEEGARNEALRARLLAEAQKDGPEETHRRLAALDPDAAREIHPRNVKRVLRALEYCLLTGEPFSRQAARSRQAESPYRALLICPVYKDRQLLYDRINRRGDALLGAGLFEGAEGLFRPRRQSRNRPRQRKPR